MAKSAGMDATDTPMITVAEAAGMLGVSERTVWRYLKSGRLAGETVGAPGLQRTLIPRDMVHAQARARAGGADGAGAHAEQERLERMLAAAQAERDALRARVASLQGALARAGRPARLERLVGGAIAVVARARG